MPSSPRNNATSQSTNNAELTSAPNKETWPTGGRAFPPGGPKGLIYNLFGVFGGGCTRTLSEKLDGQQQRNDARRP